MYYLCIRLQINISVLFCSVLLVLYLSFAMAPLKEQCHEGFAVLGQFCAKIITLRL